MLLFTSGVDRMLKCIVISEGLRVVLLSSSRIRLSRRKHIFTRNKIHKWYIHSFSVKCLI